MSNTEFPVKRISKEFASHGMGIAPNAARSIQEAEDPQAFIDALIDSLDEGTKMVDDAVIEQFIESGGVPEADAEPEGTPSEDADTDEEPDEDEDAAEEDVESTPSTPDDADDTERVDADPDPDPEPAPDTETEESVESDTDTESKEESEEDDAPAAPPHPDEEDWELVKESPRVAEDESDEANRTEDTETPDDTEEEPSTPEPAPSTPESPDIGVPGEGESWVDVGSGLSAMKKETRGSGDGVVYTMGSDPVVGDTPEARWSEMFEKSMVEPPLPDALPRSTGDRAFHIEGDITGDSRSTGTVEDFTKLFRSRYKKLSKILKRQMPGHVPLDQLTERRGGKDVSVIGMVNRQWTSRNDNAMLELEDTTDTMRVVFTDDRIQEMVDRILTDEVVGVVGQLSDDANIIFGDQLFFPDVPPMRTPNSANRDVKAVLLSDLHFGAVDFAADEWKRFVEWMRTSDEAEDIEYVLVAGDLVEGIGVYPGQEDELGVIDIYDQYVLCAEALKQLPDDVEIITIMGNHDTVRLAEPQPVLKEAFKKPFADNVTFAGNPAIVDVEGVKFQLYHGMSLNPFTDRVPGLDIHEPTGAMQLMLQKRHLAPMYGQTVRLAPEPEDYLVMEEVPDVLHTGHVHTFGMEKYKGVLMVNTGCWQYQTDFQRKLNVTPDVGYAPVIDLDTLEFEVKRF